MLDMNNIRQHRDLNEFQYLCERNAIQTLLWGYGVDEPLLLMRCGIFLQDVDFKNTGEFSTFFSRSILDPQVAQILGEKKNGEDWDIIDEHLQKGNPVLLDVDVFEMPYKKSTYFQSNHGSHTIIVDKKVENGYSILDWYHPDYFYGVMTKQMLTKARLSQNSKNQISVFSGFPINAMYRLIYMDKLNLKIDFKKSVLCTHLLSIKQITGNNGGIDFFENLCNESPPWLENIGDFRYVTAAESFFFMDLELRMMILFYEKIKKLRLFDVFDFGVIINDVIEIKKSVEKIKNRLLFSHRKGNVISDSVWKQLSETLYKAVISYVEHIIIFLNSKGN